LPLAVLIAFPVGVGLWWRIRKEKENSNAITMAAAE